MRETRACRQVRLPRRERKRRVSKTIVNLVGRYFGSWLVEKLSEEVALSGAALWLCRCRCGEIQLITTYDLVHERTLGCGKCTHPSKLTCSQGHDIQILGRTASHACRACLRAKRLMREYGLTEAEYIALWEAQGKKCAICGHALDINYVGREGWDGSGPKGRIEIDHDHKSKQGKRQSVRGLLCGGRWAGCNRKLGKIDDVAWLKQALIYIERPPAHSVLQP